MITVTLLSCVKLEGLGGSLVLDGIRDCLDGDAKGRGWRGGV